VRAVLDANVIISALLSPAGAPARVLAAWLQGEFELVLSPLLLAELERALGYPKLRKRIDADEAAAVIAWLKQSATVAPDSDGPSSVRPADPDDEYLLTLAEDQNAALVSGDKHLLALAGEAPIYSAADFLARLNDG
jgi:putative PIN family toxin of toxin-antitoxin system